MWGEAIPPIYGAYHQKGGFMRHDDAVVEFGEDIAGIIFQCGMIRNWASEVEMDCKYSTDEIVLETLGILSNSVEKLFTKAEKVYGKERVEDCCKLR